MAAALLAITLAAPLRAAPDDGTATETLNRYGRDAGQFVEQVRTRASDMVSDAMSLLGVPYRWGGDSEEEGFDCSGFTRKVFEQGLGLLLPRRAEEQARSPNLEKVKRDELQPGDLVFFKTLRRTFSHVGVYIGDGQFIHAPHRGAVVRVDSMSSRYWSKRFTGARRADEASEVVAPGAAEAAAASTER